MKKLMAVLFLILISVTVCSAQEMPDPVLPTEEPEYYMPDRDASAPVISFQPTPVPTFKQQLGEPKFKENFKKGSSAFGLAAGVTDDETMHMEIFNGKVIASPKMTYGWRTWRLCPPMFRDGIASMKIAFLSCGKGDTVGLILRAPDYSGGTGYYFGVTCQGTLNVFKATKLIETVDISDLFRSDPDDPIRIDAEVRGNHIAFYVEDVKVFEIDDDAYDNGYSGFYTAQMGENTMQAQISDFEIYY